jgi:hypothetical protein
MSALGATVGRATGALGGPAVTTVIVVAGVAAGVLGGGLFASGGLGGGASASASGQLAVYPCPETGPVLATITGGQQMLATGRTEDSTWLRIHYPAPGRTEAWVEAGPLQVDGSVAALPVAECEPELVVAPPSLEPTESFTAIQGNPDVTPTPTIEPTPTVGPTPTPTATANARPGISSLTASTGQISFDTGNYCPKAVKRVTFRVKATDAVGIAGVTLVWRKPGGASVTQSAMHRVSGSDRDGFWEVTLDTAANGIDRAGSLTYYALARDVGGATRRIPAARTNSIQVKVCENKGPTVGATSSSGGSLFWDPLGVSKCQTATNLIASIKDSDGVKSATLFYRRPGAGGFASKPMDNSTIKGKWYANLDTLGDKITIPDPPTGTLRWYVKATDAKGASTQMPTKSITIRRCDTEASFDGVFPTSTSYACSTTVQIHLKTYAQDDDQPNHNLKVVFHWSLYNPRTQTGPIGGTAAATIKDGVVYEGDTSSFSSKTYYYAQLSVYAVTTDRYGGTTRTPTEQYVMGDNC